MDYHLSLLFLALCWHIHVRLNDVNSALVVDEVYHVPQAQRYCAGNFSYWDNKITTPPGLYLLSAGVNRSLSNVQGVDSCSVFGLRLTNVVLLSLIPMLVVGIFKAKRKSIHFGDYVAAVALPCLPVLFFTSFFYYTDTLATVLVLTLALFRYRKQHWLAAVAGLLSLSVRQTNVIWVAYFGADATFDAIVRFCRCFAKEKKRNIDDALDTPTMPKVILSLLQKMNWKSRLELVYNGLLVATPYLIVIAAFAVFLVWNGGVVVGDKQAHVVSTHTPQVLYFCVFTALLSWPTVLSQLPLLANGFKSVGGVILFCILCGLCFLSLHFNTRVHKYLLADNRHYSFYVWKRFLGQPWSKYVLTPMAAVGARFLSSTVRGDNLNFLSKVTFLSAIVFSLAFQELFEFRYFVIPFLLSRLHFPVSRPVVSLAELATYILINWGTYHVYVTKTFRWPGMGELQRIIW